MAVYVICYDLVRATESDYKNVHEAIHAISNDWAHLQLSTFIVNSSLSAFQIRDRLRPHFTLDEKLVVAQIGNQVAGLHKLSKQVGEWFDRNGIPSTDV